MVNLKRSGMERSRSRLKYCPATEKNNGTPQLQWHTQEFCSRGVQQIQLRAEDRENGNLGAVAPSQGLWRQL